MSALHPPRRSHRGTSGFGHRSRRPELRGRRQRRLYGEVSAAMLAALGCRYVILGHSERRQYYGETSATLNKKMAQAFANGLQPIYCVGENLEEREADRHFDVVKTQIEEVIYNLTPAQFARTVIAYERLGDSARARPRRQSRHRKSTPTSARSCARNSVRRPMKLLSSTEVPANRRTPRNSSPKRTWTAA